MLNSASSTSVMARACDVLPARGHMTGTDEASGVAWSVPDDRALICFPFTGGLVGGSHISALKLIQNLDRSRFEPLIVLHDDKGPVRDFLNEHQVPFEPAPCPMYMAPGDMLGRQAIRTPGAILTLARFLRRRRVRIVHTNDGPMHVTWGLAARLAAVPQLWHHRGNPGARGARFVAPWTAARMVAVSKYAAPSKGKFGLGPACGIVHSPFDPAAAAIDKTAARRRALEQLQVSDDTVLLGLFGHFSDRKRPLVFVDMVAALRKRWPDRQILGLMFGKEFEPGLEGRIGDRIAELGLGGVVRKMGFCAPAEPWIAACDALVVTAVEEPFGRTLIEAMLVRTPVIAAASGGNCEAIRHMETGLLVQPDNPDAFAAAVTSLLGDGAAAAAIVSRAYEEAMTKFGIRCHVEAIEATYRDLLT